MRDTLKRRVTIRLAMHEAKKLDEAAHFLSAMMQHQRDEDRTAFAYNLSAFLTAARSVLQYALEEIKKQQTPEGKRWYETAMHDPMFGFLKDARDTSMHRAPVPASKRFMETVNLQTKTTVSVSATLMRNGKIVGTSFIEKLRTLLHRIVSRFFATRRLPITANALTSWEYRFSAWQGSENTCELCEKYLQRLHDVVADGQKHGFLTR